MTFDPEAILARIAHARAETEEPDDQPVESIEEIDRRMFHGGDLPAIANRMFKN